MWFTHLFSSRVAHSPLSACTGLLNGPPGAQPEISSREGWEKHTIFEQKHTIFGQKHTLFGRQEGGGSKGLNEKNRPQVVCKFLGPPLDSQLIMHMCPQIIMHCALAKPKTNQHGRAQMLCLMRIMHLEIMHYENLYCTS